MKELERIFGEIKNTRYEHREGGRYAYVQLMALIRQLKEELDLHHPGSGFLPALYAAAELLNALVPLRFEEGHRLVFEQKKKEFEDMAATLCVTALEVPDTGNVVALV
jgi:hypothetical protein